MSYFIRYGNIYRVMDEKAVDLKNELPVGNYLVKFSQESGFYLESMDEFEMPPKLYGSTTKTALRILNTFASRPFQTGVWLNGEKGSGKTLLARTVSIEGAKQGYPTLVINSSFGGDSFNKFIQDIDVPAIIIFDEFEKTYGGDVGDIGNVMLAAEKAQESVLTLLDGVIPTKKLFMMTTNDSYKVNSNIKNRPGRVFYALNFHGLEKEFIREYAEDTLINRSHVDKVCQVSSMFATMNFDMLKALIEEINRYDEDPIDALKFLNAKPENSGKIEYDIGIIIDDKQMIMGFHDDDQKMADMTVKWTGNIFADKCRVAYYETDKIKDEEDDDWYHPYRITEFVPSDIYKVSEEQGRVLFKNKDGHIGIFERRKISMLDYAQAFAYGE